MKNDQEPKFLPCGEGCSAENVAAMAADGWKRCTHSITHRTESDHKLCAHGPMCLWCKPTGPESDFKPGSCDHEWSGRDGRCGMCGVRQSDEGTGVDRALNPDVTRNAMSPDELWAMQEKPRVSDDAPDMGPIPGTEGIESDPPVSDLSVEGSPPGGNQVPESPLRTHCPHGTYLHDDICMMPECFVMQHSHIEAELMRAKAERDHIRARADYLNKALNEAHAKIAVLKDSLADALNYRKFYRDEHKECERLRAIIVAALDANLDHDCGLEGYDEDCSECVLAKLLFDYAKERRDAQF